MLSVTKFFGLQRSIFGICPHSQRIFRLSECRLVVNSPRADWLDRLVSSEEQIERAEERLSNREYGLREKARALGRKQAQRLVRRVDPVFTPRRLDAQDAKPLFHPISFAVFKGLAARNKVSGITLLDGSGKSPERRTIQRSIERCISQHKYEWATFRVTTGGVVERE